MVIGGHRVGQRTEDRGQRGRGAERQRGREAEGQRAEGQRGREAESREAERGQKYLPVLRAAQDVVPVCVGVDLRLH
jgi:hypothetical protein